MREAIESCTKAGERTGVRSRDTTTDQREGGAKTVGGMGAEPEGKVVQSGYREHAHDVLKMDWWAAEVKPGEFPENHLADQVAQTPLGFEVKQVLAESPAS